MWINCDFVFSKWDRAGRCGYIVGFIFSVGSRMDGLGFC